MFSYVFMKLLERRPTSYDRRMEIASRGRVRAAKGAVAAEVSSGQQVLEIGCGTGELGAMMCARGASVEGFDLSPSMVEVARRRIAAEGLDPQMTVRQMGVDGMDELPGARYDVVVATLVLSELSDDERRFALRNAARVLRPGGRLVVADEARPRSPGRRALHAAVRAPMVAATYLVSRSSTHPLCDLAAEVDAVGLSVQREERSHGDAFLVLVAEKPEEEAGR